jgi:NAD(P)-dependent dehydrogenase (short-subunit alcohol dehydrogenase family)
MQQPDVRVPAEMFGLTGKIVLVTGASSGLGARWVPVLGAAGATVVITARRTHELALVAATAAGTLALPGDITDAAHREYVIAEMLDRYGHIDVVVNNAGTAMSKPALDTSVEEFSDMIDTDLTSVFALSTLAGRAMVGNGGGSIINITSLGAERCLDRYKLAAYNAAKAGVVALTRSLAEEWGADGVRVNAVAPAFFPTRLSGFLEDPEQVRWVEHHTSLKRVARLDELDGMIVFLASDASSYITGQHLLVDGGWSVY